MKLELEILSGVYTIHRLDPTDDVPPQIGQGDIRFTVRSERELSIICSSDIQLDARVSDPGWRGLRVAGQLDFDMVGVLAGLTACLATAGIPVFVVSTFETDYLLVKNDRLASAIISLENAGYAVLEAQP